MSAGVIYLHGQCGGHDPRAAARPYGDHPPQRVRNPHTSHPFPASTHPPPKPSLTSPCLCSTRYDLPEKVAIAKQYLIPKARTEAGIAADKEEVPASLGISEGTSHEYL